MEPRNQKERDMMLNECALMQANKGDTIINCVEAFIFCAAFSVARMQLCGDNCERLGWKFIDFQASHREH